jgi:multisubunit Na+/H+ antiporter MnhG subunit
MRNRKALGLAVIGTNLALVAIVISLVATEQSRPVLILRIVLAALLFVIASVLLFYFVRTTDPKE